MIIKMIKWYQIMPFSSHHFCNFEPTCSHYMIDALNEYGLYKGLKLGIKRILKCHPFGKFGYDPIKKEN